MTNKISKSDKLDKEQEARDRTWLFNQPESQHFTAGTEIVYRNKKGFISTVSACGRRLLVSWEDGSVSLINPVALNR